MSKNYVVCGDLMSGLKTLDHPLLFQKAKEKFEFLANEVYKVQNRLDEDLASYSVDETKKFFAEKKKAVESTKFDQVYHQMDLGASLKAGETRIAPDNQSIISLSLE